MPADLLPPGISIEVRNGVAQLRFASEDLRAAYLLLTQRDREASEDSDVRIRGMDLLDH